jgi:hypothetical protein
VWLGSNKWY